MFWIAMATLVAFYGGFLLAAMLASGKQSNQQTHTMQLRSADRN